MNGAFYFTHCYMPVYIFTLGYILSVPYAKGVKLLERIS
jgi:hypothetical protein